MKNKVLLVGMTAMMMTACTPQGYQAIQDIASQTTDDIACKDQKLEEKLWDGLKSYLIEQEAIPAAEDLKSAFREQLNSLAEANPQWSSVERWRLQEELDQLVDSLLSEAPNGERVQNSQELLLLLSAIDVGDRTTVFRSYMQDKVRGQFTKLQKTVQSYELDCNPSQPDGEDDDQQNTDPETPSRPDEGDTEVTERNYEYHKQRALSQGESLATFGGRWAFATAYQSCQSVQIPSVTSQTPDVKGITVTGKHSDGVGNKREIASLSQVQSSHPYIRDMNQYGSSCFNVRSNPLIYDYGGKPYGTTSSTSTIDFFKNNGSGTKVLGVDCSAYIYTALASAGLRLKEGRALKASDSWAWGSTSYVEPQRNGLTCLDKISITGSSSIRAGDVVAVKGHVFLIDKIGSDPFGLRTISKESDCSKISAKSFNFVVAQSSPSIGGVGINYFDARDYLPTSEKMRTGLEKYAYYACLAKFNGKSYKPDLGTLSVVRHKGTSSCLGTRVKLAKEACIQGCSSLER